MPTLITPRVVKNLTTGSIESSTSGWTDFNDSNITFTNNNETATFNFNPAGDLRCFISRTIPALSGESYALRFTVTNKSGTFSRENVDVIGVLSPTLEINNIENGERAIVATANADGNLLFRIGFGIDNSDASVDPASFTISNVQIEKLPTGQTVPSEYVNINVFSHNTVGIPRDVNSTLASPADGGLLTESYGTLSDSYINKGLAVISDSFGDETDEFTKLLENADDQRFVHGITVGGTKLIDTTTTLIDQVVAQGKTYNTNAIDAGVLILEQSVNDIVGNETATNLIAHLSTLVNHAKSKGLGVIVCTTPPFGNNTGHTSLKEVEAIAYSNLVISTFAGDSEVQVVDLLSTLRDGTTFNLASTFDSGDGLHPSPAGSIAIRDAMEVAVTALGERTVEPNALYTVCSLTVSNSYQSTQFQSSTVCPLGRDWGTKRYTADGIIIPNYIHDK